MPIKRPRLNQIKVSGPGIRFNAPDKRYNPLGRPAINKDLERNVSKEKRDKAAHAKKLEEMRNEGATTGEGDLARTVEAEKKKLKAKRAVR